jgi:hypothetical protein
VVEQGTHKPLVGGSNPPSATNPSTTQGSLGLVGGRIDFFMSPVVAIRLVQASVSVIEGMTSVRGSFGAPTLYSRDVAALDRRSLHPEAPF